MTTTWRPRLAVVAIIRRADDVLLVRRSRPPAAGWWALPGGRVEPGETLEAAVRREVLEETGLAVHVGTLVGVVEREDADSGTRWIIAGFDVRTADEPEPRAGDDAAEVSWWPVDDLGRPGVVPSVDRLVGRTPAP